MFELIDMIAGSLPGIPSGSGGGENAGTGGTPADWALLFFFLGLAIFASFLCSLLEAAFLSLPRSYVAMLIKEGNRSGRMMKELKDKVDRPLAAILTLNTVAHTLGASGVGAMVVKIFGDKWVFLAGVIITLLILVASEIIPKTLGARHAKRLVGFTVHTTRLIIWITWPIVIALEQLSKLLGGGHKDMITRAEVATIAEMGRHAGVLQEGESRVIGNLLGMRNVLISDVMTPRPVVFMLAQTMTVADVLKDHPMIPFSRIPVYGDTPDDITGLVLRHDILAAYSSGRTDTPLARLLKDVAVIPEVTTVQRAMEQFLKKRVHLMLAVDEFGGTAGIVTLEDAIETLLGVEIVDETDSVDDMRSLARTRMERKRQERAERRGMATSAAASAGLSAPPPEE